MELIVYIGVVGSITHCDGYRACAAAREANLAAIGIDAEPNKPLPSGVLAAIALPKEREGLIEMATKTPDVNWDRLLFSMKESVFKAWFPLTGERLGFEDAIIAIDPFAGKFTARLPIDSAWVGIDSARLSGLWVARDGLLITSVGHPPSNLT